MHLLIPFACSSVPACEPALRSLQLPQLEKLVRRLAQVRTDSGSASSLTPPHERALARLFAIPAPDGCVAWAAHEAAQSGRDPGAAAWAWITPVHWDVGADHITMADPRALDLQEVESRALMVAMQPFFKEDGIALDFAAPHRWLARGKVFATLASASLDRVAGRKIARWMPTAASLRRLQNEMQMLLYTHPVNDARSARALATVNSFWISGSGALPKTAIIQPPPQLVVVGALREAALRNDWEQWAQCWTQVDQRECRNLLDSLDAGDEAQLTLCGDRNALTFGPARNSLLERLQRRFKSAPLHALQDRL